MNRLTRRAEYEAGNNGFDERLAATALGLFVLGTAIVSSGDGTNGEISTSDSNRQPNNYEIAVPTSEYPTPESSGTPAAGNKMHMSDNGTPFVINDTPEVEGAG